MRRIVYLLLLVAGCHDNNNKSSPDLSMTVNVDLGSDASSCTTDGAACTRAGGSKGLCKSGACTACTDPTDDLACDTAYGQPSMHFICGAGACVSGCRASTDCGGQICGLASANVCSACTTDAQCQMAIGAGNVCDATGKCVSSACATANAACTTNTNDFCCAATVGNACVSGNCCATADCGGGGKTCINHVCTTCPSPSPGILVVDPADVSSGAPTGADLAGCRYKTITAAVGASPAPGTTIRVIGTQTLSGTAATCTAHTGECYPIAVNAGISIIGDNTMPPTISAPEGGSVAFSMGAAGGRLSALTLDGANAGGTPSADHGVNVLAAVASPSPAPSLDNVTIKRFGVDGVQVGAGILQINAGVNITANGAGIDVNGTTAVVLLSSSTTPITINGNMDDGILVTHGAVTATGTPGTLGAGTIQINQNTNGVNVNQATPGTTSAFAVNLTGVTIWANTNDGVDIAPGTPVKLRGCYVLYNTRDGVRIASVSAVDQTTMDLIDLGKANDGNNTLQYATVLTQRNTATGICLAIPATNNPILRAQGNFFGTNNCMTTAAGLGAASATCTGGGNIGIMNAGPTVDTTMCTVP